MFSGEGDDGGSGIANNVLSFSSRLALIRQPFHHRYFISMIILS